MANTLRILVDNPDDLLADGAYGAGALVRVQAGASSGGPFADLSGTGADPTIPIVAGDRSYNAEDPTGTSVTWYRTRYENVGATRTSDWSVPFQAGGTLCTIAQAKAALGVTDAVDDDLLAEIIVDVSDEIEHFTGRRLSPDNGATYTFDTALGHRLRIPRGIRAVTSMGIAATDQPDSGGTYQSVTASAILLRPGAAHRRPGWPPTEVVLTASPIDTRIPFRTAANGATITGDFGFAATPPAVRRIAIAASVRQYLDRRRGGSAGPDALELPGILEPSELAALQRLRGPGGIA